MTVSACFKIVEPKFVQFVDIEVCKKVRITIVNVFLYFVVCFCNVFNFVKGFE